MEKAIILTLALSTLSAIGCDDSGGSQRVPDEPLSPRATATATAKPSSVSLYADEDLAVPPDFEAEADEQINEDNYRQKLEEIEDQMGVERDGGTDAGATSGGDGKPDAGAAAATPAQSPPPPKPPTGAKPPPPKRPPPPPKPKGGDGYDD